MKTPIDLLVEARWMIPVEPADVVLENHAIAVDKGRIVALLQHSDAEAHYSPRAICRLPQHIVIPGLVNLHTHAATTLLRGLGDDLPPGDWLHDRISPVEARWLSPSFVHDGTLLACAEMLLGGITCFNDMYFYPRAAAKAALSMHMRAAIGLIAADFPTPYAADADDYLAKGLAARDELRDEALLSFCLAANSPDSLDDRACARILTLAEQCDLPIHMHLHETQAEIERSRRRYGVRPGERLRRLGLLSPGLIAAQGNHLDADEIALLGQHGCSIARCPGANLGLENGVTPLAKLADKAINVGLGSDGAAINYRLDLFGEMRLAALQGQRSGEKSEALAAHRALHMATLGGARALGLDARIGSLAVGKAADLCAVNAVGMGFSPCYNPASLLVYCAGREHVTDVWIGGQKRVEGGCLLESEEIELIKLAALWQNQICPRNV